MRRVASCLAALTALSSTGVYAKAASIRCTPHHETIRSGDNAMALALRSGVDANHFATWLKKADPVTRKALKSMRPGDVFDACLAPAGTAGDSLVSLRITRDEAGRKLAAQQTDQPAQASGSLVAGVTGDAVSTARLVATQTTTQRAASISDHAAHDANPPAQASGPLFAGVTGDAVSTARLVATTQPAAPISKQLAQHVVATANPVIKPLAPGHLLSEELTRLLGHHPVVAATIAYAREKWHLPERLPKGSHCSLALLPAAGSSSRMQLAYFQFDYQGRTERVYHYVDSLGHDLMVNAHGQSYRVLDPLLPVPDARISSGWGWRIQPVLGGDEFHQGVDYAAPSGTPVRATMDGVVDISEWRGDYGRLIEVRHNGNLSTRYAHLSAVASRIRLGSRVHRGDVIGYVGSTGLSTGPHLYYEVWDHGVRINPLVHQQWMVIASLDPHERQRFGQYVTSIKDAP